MVSVSDVENTINEYLKFTTSQEAYEAENDPEKEVQILALESVKKEYTYKENIEILLKLKNETSERGVRCAVSFFDSLDQLLFVEMMEVPPKMGVQKFKLIIQGGKLAPISIKVAAAIDIPSIKLFDVTKDFLQIRIIDLDVKLKKFGDRNIGVILADGIWENIN